MFSLIEDHKRQYIMSIMLSVLISGIDAALHPLLMKSIFDSVTNRSGGYSYFVVATEYLFFGIAMNLINYKLFAFCKSIDSRIVLSVSKRMLTSYYNEPYYNVLKNGAGYYISKVRSDVKDGLAPALATFREISVGIASLFVLILVLMFISLPAFLILFILIPACAVISIRLRRKIKELTGNERDYEASTLHNLSTAIHAWKIVSGYRLVEKTVASYAEILERGMAFSIEKQRMVRLLQVFGDLTRLFSDVMSIVVGAFFVLYGTMTVGSFVAFMNAFWRCSSILFTVLNKSSELHGHAEIIERISEFSAITPAQSYRSNINAVKIENISFEYGNSRVLKNFSLEITQSEKVLIIGKNGSGKTTLANILSGYLIPTSGKVYLPEKISSSTLPIHFPPTCMSDLNIADELLTGFSLDQEEISSCRLDSLSSGQQKKLAVALTISVDADLYILDEPTANLDPDSRRMMLGEIFARTNHAALVVIAHDMDDSTAQFDRVIDITRS